MRSYPASLAPRAIDECRAAGVPGHILIPLLPADVGFPDVKGVLQGHGKAPAKFEPAGGWAPLSKWQQGGIGRHVLNAANLEGGNGGLLLGAVANEAQYVAIDIDLNAGLRAVDWCHRLIDRLQRQVGATAHR